MILMRYFQLLFLWRYSRKDNRQQLVVGRLNNSQRSIYCEIGTIKTGHLRAKSRQSAPSPSEVIHHCIRERLINGHFKVLNDP